MCATTNGGTGVKTWLWDGKAASPWSFENDDTAEAGRDTSVNIFHGLLTATGPRSGRTSARVVAVSHMFRAVYVRILP